MSTVTPHSCIHSAGRNTDMKRVNGFLLLFFFSAVVFADANGLLKLPESYRTPLSDMAYDDMKEWRADPEDENPWRRKDDETVIKPRIKLDLFPKYEHKDDLKNPSDGVLFQNVYEISKPVSNILEYSF
jgi:hypothetical protein